MPAADPSAVRRLLSLKRAGLQTRIDALAAQQSALHAGLARLAAQGSGLSGQVDGSDFQVAAKAGGTARARTARLESRLRDLETRKTGLAREKLALDIADRKLAEEESKAARLNASRAADRV
ncbi:MAG: hypothetical protein AAF311_08965 [Pseudomonadota bacterium]